MDLSVIITFFFDKIFLNKINLASNMIALFYDNLNGLDLNL